MASESQYPSMSVVLSYSQRQWLDLANYEHTEVMTVPTSRAASTEVHLDSFGTERNWRHDSRRARCAAVYACLANVETRLISR